jgi:hypothetical protein
MNLREKNILSVKIYTEKKYKYIKIPFFLHFIIIWPLSYYKEETIQSQKSCFNVWKFW